MAGHGLFNDSLALLLQLFNVELKSLGRFVLGGGDDNVLQGTGSGRLWRHARVSTWRAVAQRTVNRRAKFLALSTCSLRATRSSSSCCVIFVPSSTAAGVHW